MTSAISQLVYMPNFRAIEQIVREKNGNKQKHRNTERQKHRQTHLNFIIGVGDFTVLINITVILPSRIQAS